MDGPLRILLIDDDENSFVITRELLLEIDGREVQLDWVDEAATGLEQILQARHDVYLVDYRLGAEDGIDLLRRARATGAQSRLIPIRLMLNSSTVKQAVVRAIQASSESQNPIFA